MKVKRFFASDMRKALNQVRDEFGSNAVILSNRKQKQGIEIVAGVEEHKSRLTAPQESIAVQGKDLNWMEDPLLVDLKNNMHSIQSLLRDHLSDLIYKDYKRKHPIETSLRIQMMSWGIEKNLTKKISDLIEKKEHFEFCLEECKKIISEIITVYPDLLERERGVFAFFGHSGVGKTSLILKLATALAIQHGSHDIAFISADDQMVSSFDPLMNYSKIMDSPVKRVCSPSEMKEALELFSDKKFIFIDTPGFIKKCDAFQAEKTIFLNLLSQIECFLVLDGRDQYVNQVVSYETYSDCFLKASFITKLDETVRLGDSFSLLMRSNIPLAYCSQGHKIPDHLLYPHVDLLINRFFGNKKQSPFIEFNEWDEIDLVDLIEQA